MRIGFFDGDMAGAKSAGDFVANAIAAEEAGLDSYWSLRTSQATTP